MSHTAYEISEWHGQTQEGLVILSFTMQVLWCTINVGIVDYSMIWEIFFSRQDESNKWNNEQWKSK